MAPRGARRQLDQGSQPLGGVREALNDCGERFDVYLLPVAKCCHDKLVAVAEVSVEAALRDSESSRERLNCNRPESAVGNRLEGGAFPVIGGELLDMACHLMHSTAPYGYCTVC